MQIGADSMQDAKQPVEKRWLSIVRGASLVGVLGLLVAGCDSYNPVDWVGGDGPPKPQQIALPAEDAADAGEIPEGLVADSADRKYDESSSRADVTVVRPLRNTKPPKVTVGSQDAPQPSSAPTVAVTAAETATQSDLPGDPPVLDEGVSKETAMATAPVDTGDALQGLDSFSAQSYSLSFLAATIPFNHGSAHLDSNDRAVLKQVVAQFKDTGGAITVVGHASSRTGDMSPVEHKLANFDISVRRAETVARALIRMGVPARALYVGAVSDSEPMYQEVMPAGEAENRRTEIFLNQ